MKKNFTYFLFAFFIYSSTGFSQNIDFPEDNAVWKEMQTTIAGPHEQHLVLCGDTLINGVSYSQVYALQVDSQLQITGRYYQGGLRQEDQQVYFIYNGNANEFLLYDFSVETGEDISMLIFGTDQVSLIVDTVQVEFLAGKMRKVVYFESQVPNCTFPAELWIEGIGSSYGLLTRGLNPCLVADAGGQLLCYEHEDDYLNLTLIECFLPELNNCSLVNSTDDFLSEKMEITISPNPSSSHIFVNLNNKEFGQNWSVNIYNAIGEMVEVEINKNRNGFESNIAHLPSGIYLIEIINEKSMEIGVGKLLKI